MVWGIALDYLFFLALGLAVGSFLNVVVYRLPRGESIVVPPSHCPACGQRLGPLDLVPVASFLWLRCRCRACHGRIGLRYPLVEAAVGLGYVLAYFYYGLTGPLAAMLVLWPLLLAVTLIDLEHLLIPNGLTLFGLVAGVGLGLAAGQPPLALAGGLAAGAGPLLILALATGGRGMGGGDVKLAGVLGVFLGWRLVLLALFLAAVAGSVVGVGLILTGRHRRRDPIPFGPFLALGALVALAVGEGLLAWYWGLWW